MKKYWLAVFAIVCVAILHAAPAQAQATRTWVSGVGDDANPCSRTAPCKTFAGAISKTATFGEINCLDPGGFGAVTITKSISIVCDYTEGGILSAGTNGVNVNDSATGSPNSIIVTLKGLDIECAGSGLIGINFSSGAVLHVHKTQIRNCRGNANATGISVTTSAGTSELYVADSYITDNGTSATTGGILVKPTGSGSVNVDINRTQIENNSIGVRVDTTSTTGSIHGAVRDSMVAGNTNNGITVVGPTTISTLMVDRSSMIGNAFGLVVNGLQSSMRVTESTVTGNTTGLFVNGSGHLISNTTNYVEANTAGDGAFTDHTGPQ